MRRAEKNALPADACLLMTSPYVIATLLFYAASLALYIWNLREPSRAAGIGATSCLVVGLGLHYLALLARSRLIHAVPYDDLFGSLSLFAWLLAATYLCLEAIHRRRAVGPFVLPIVLGVFLLAHLPEARPVKAPPAQGPLFAFHVTLNILAYSAFAISFVLSIIFLVQNWRLRNRKLGEVGWRFPALDVLERMTRSSVLIGCASLAAGVTAGLIYGAQTRGKLLERRSKGDHHSFDFLDLCGLYGFVPDGGVARGARFGALHIQFHVRHFQLQYRESVSISFSPILLSRDVSRESGN